MATNTNLEKIDGAVALIEATESTLRRVDKDCLSRNQSEDFVYATANLNLAKQKLQTMLAELKQKEGREPWQKSDT